MVTPDQQRAAADYLGERYGVSQRRASGVMGRCRSTVSYRRQPGPDEPALTREIKRLARRHPRYGYRRIRAMLVRRGWTVNLKRVRRLWIELGLKRPVRLRKARKLGPKPGASANSCTERPARFKQHLLKSGRVSSLPTPADPASRPVFEPIALEGELLSETIIRERR